MTSTLEDQRTEPRRALKIDVDPTYRQRIKVRAAESGVTMREYILAALERGFSAIDEEAETKK